MAPLNVQSQTNMVTIIIIVSIAVLGVIANVAWVYLIGYPKYRAYKAEKARIMRAQADQQQWLDQVKASRSSRYCDPPAISQQLHSQEHELYNLPPGCGAVLEVNAPKALPPRDSMALDYAWPVNTTPMTQAPPVVLETPPAAYNPAKSMSPYDSMLSYETYGHDLELAYRTPTVTNNRPGDVLAAVGGGLIRLKPAQPRIVQVPAKAPKLPQTVIVFPKSSPSYDGFEDVNLDKN